MPRRKMTLMPQITRTKIKKLKLLLMTCFLASATMGCAVTSLQCGVDGDSSFVNLNATPGVLSQASRAMTELCSFAYSPEDT